MSNRQSAQILDDDEPAPNWGARSDAAAGGDGLNCGLGGDPWQDIEPALEKEIIPRLMMAFQESPHEAPQDTPKTPPSAGSLGEFADIILHNDAISAINYVHGLHADGVSLQAIYLSLVTDTARTLGEMWKEDECSFFDVTVGVSRLQQVMLDFSHSFCSQHRTRGLAKFSALIAPMPGEQHSFGQFMVVEFFRRAGWNVHGTAPRSVDALELLVAQQHFDVVGLSVSGDRCLDQLGTTISRLREASYNNQLKVLIGGHSVAVRDGLVEEMGADATAGDGNAAVAAADRLVNV